MKNLIGASLLQYNKKKNLALEFLSENGMYGDNKSTFASAIAEYLLWVEGLSARLPEGQSQQYVAGQALAKAHMSKEEVVKSSNPSPNEEFNKGYWDYIKAERKRLEEFFASIEYINNNR